MPRYGPPRTLPSRSLLGQIIGIDLGDRQHAICVLTAAGEIEQERTLPVRVVGRHPRRIVGSSSNLPLDRASRKELISVGESFDLGWTRVFDTAV